MKFDPDRLRAFAEHAGRTARTLAKLEQDLIAVSKDQISPCDVDLQGAYDAAFFSREITPMLERMD